MDERANQLISRRGLVGRGVQSKENREDEDETAATARQQELLANSTEDL